jgi:hypothetical protein
MEQKFTRELMNEEFAYERANFKQLLAVDLNYFGNLGIGGQQVVQPIYYNVYYEQITAVGFNPVTNVLEATLHINQPNGFGSYLCTAGSYEYVRFYLDYGSGWEDQGIAGVNAHDIPTWDICQEMNKPLSYVVTLPITPKKQYCNTPVIPKLRAILSWNVIPPASTPDYNPIWGNTFDCNVQIAPRPKWIFDIENIQLSEILQVAVTNPDLSINQATQITGGEQSLSSATSALSLKELSITELSNIYANQAGVHPGRFGLKDIKAIYKQSDTSVFGQQTNYFKTIGIDWSEILKFFDSTKANVDYEELTDVGLDYNKEQFVASVHIKRFAGYSGDLCTAGSYEYVSFWADWDDKCEWEYLGTSSVNVHDIAQLPDGGLCYSVTLPYDFTYKHKNCQQANVVKIRAVLSWNIAPSATDPNELETYGNYVDRFIQVKPGLEVNEGDPLPYFYVLGGIPVDMINNTTGLTTSGASFALNAVPVAEGAPFAGIVVIQGPSYENYYYRIRVTNLATSAWHYLTDPLWLVGYSQFPLPPHNTYQIINPDASGFYAYQSKGSTFDNNIDNVLARWTPDGNDKWQIDLEIQGVPGTFSKIIQMDNTAPVAIINVDGDCTHDIGLPITGNFTATDNYISGYTLSSTFEGFGTNTIATGAINAVNHSFSFNAPSGSLCGRIDLSVTEKTIHDSAWTGYTSYDPHIICLKTNA